MIFISLILQIVHLPASISDYRPDILVLVLIFFSMNSHFTLKLETAWLIGIILDLVTGAPLGINAFVISTQIYLINTQFKNFPKYSLWQQAIIIGVINLIVNVLGYWIEHIIGQSYYEVNFILPTFITAVFWPIVYVISYILCSTFSIDTEDNEKID